ncbi:hypothetical protein PACTADRAFT_1014 [Pachysolen tannophilus NRRL Y-2460]|uniref:Uncharacterized protein n=1 Tax=Pachysolen tannophilus NRRL Y-2460 TaxID=669874 RepID=A0A1E4U3F7_PACTA|nr:hypothetical protein PACTADRAFT_1014 [Pachysolen tannophilus NRRL Y-2460]
MTEETVKNDISELGDELSEPIEPIIGSEGEAIVTSSPIKKLPELPPRSNTATVSDKSNQLPSYESVSSGMNSIVVKNGDEDEDDKSLPPLPPRSPNSSRLHNTDKGEKVHSHQRQRSFNRSNHQHQHHHNHKNVKIVPISYRLLVANDLNGFLITNHCKMMDLYFLYLKNEDLIDTERNNDLIIDNRFEQIRIELKDAKKEVDLRFWEYLIKNYNDVANIEDLKFFNDKINLEFSSLSNNRLRFVVYLSLSKSVEIKDELYQTETEIVKLENHNDFINGLENENEREIIKNFINLKNVLPHQYILEFIKLILQKNDVLNDKIITNNEIFNITLSLNYQINTLISPSKESSNLLFYFQLSRALEDNCLKVLFSILEYVPFKDFYDKLITLFNDSEFWINFFHRTDDSISLKLLDSFILKGFEILIVIFVKLIKYNESKILENLKLLKTDIFNFFKTQEFLKPLDDLSFYNLKIIINFYNYKKELKVLNKNESVSCKFSAKSNHNVKVLKESNEKLLTKKSTIKKNYQDILNNYQQLNQEIFNNETLIKNLKNEKIKLQNELNDLIKKQISIDSSLEILNKNNNRNDEIERLNKDLVEQIKTTKKNLEDLNTRVSELKANK